jgi:hypothetical protein
MMGAARTAHYFIAYYSIVELLAKVLRSIHGEVICRFSLLFLLLLA